MSWSPIISYNPVADAPAQNKLQIYGPALFSTVDGSYSINNVPNGEGISYPTNGSGQHAYYLGSTQVPAANLTLNFFVSQTQTDNGAVSPVSLTPPTGVYLEALDFYLTDPEGNTVNYIFSSVPYYENGTVILSSQDVGTYSLKVVPYYLPIPMTTETYIYAPIAVTTGTYSINSTDGSLSTAFNLHAPLQLTILYNLNILTT